MTPVRRWSTCRNPLAAGALALVLGGLVGCAAGPAVHPLAIAPKSPDPVASTAPEDPCTAFACEE